MLAMAMIFTSAIPVFAASTTSSDYTTWKSGASDYASGYPLYYHNPVFDDMVRYDGIDVSVYQRDIDWQKVKAAGIDFAIIRVGGRYYVSGGLYSDSYFEKNYEEATAAGIKVGVYFYSQAKTEAEAREEVAYILDILDGRELDLPIYMDYEYPSGSRLSGMSKTQGTKNVKAFCSAVEEAGYDAGFYSYLSFISNYVDGEEISSLYSVWIAQYYNRCEYEYDYEMWQYSSSGKVDGISGRVDVNYWYVSTSTLRVYGDNRYETAQKVADTIKEYKGISKFDSVIVASGTDYPDAMSASILAKEKEAPILLVNSLSVNETSVMSYISSNLSEGKTVYIVGGTSAVSQSMENRLKSAGYNVVRLGGANRYETNLAILEECGEITEGLIVSSGLGYADTLSASATGLPILLVGNSLTEDQLALISSVSGTVYIAGGTSAVSSKIESQIKKVTSQVTRFAGANRYETSYMIANEFFSDSGGVAILAYGGNYPDGLVAGVLGQVMDAPVILVNNNNTSYAKKYVQAKSIISVMCIAGPSLVSNSALNKII